jgi:hypothetical protein
MLLSLSPLYHNLLMTALRSPPKPLHSRSSFRPIDQRPLPFPFQHHPPQASDGCEHGRRRGRSVPSRRPDGRPRKAAEEEASWPRSLWRNVFVPDPSDGGRGRSDDGGRDEGGGREADEPGRGCAPGGAVPARLPDGEVEPDRLELRSQVRASDGNNERGLACSFRR